MADDLVIYRYIQKSKTVLDGHITYIEETR